MRSAENIDSFISESGEGDCRLLKRLFSLDKQMRKSGKGGVPEITLFDPPERYGGTVLYDPRFTPKNAIAFATTGGDDVHFSLLTLGKGFGDNSPVVMTVPMAGDSTEEANLILGANLQEFLCLGCVHGFFELEQLMYARDATLAKYSKQEHEDTFLYNDDDAEAFRIFRNELDLKPWPDVPSRLRELQDYFCRLKFKRSWLRFFRRND